MSLFAGVENLGPGILAGVGNLEFWLLSALSLGILAGVGALAMEFWLASAIGLGILVGVGACLLGCWGRSQRKKNT